MDGYETADRLVRLSEKAASIDDPVVRARVDRATDAFAEAFADTHRRQRRFERRFAQFMITFLVLVVLSGMWVAYLAIYGGAR
jgi:hypothetical protein